MRIVFMGTPDFAVYSLEALSRSGDVALVVTQPDKPQGRRQVMAPPPVKVKAMELGIPTFQPESMRSPEAIGRVRAERPDVIVVAAYGQILPQELLEVPRYCCVNVHASLLPRYRGASPIQWAILNGDDETGVTIMRMDAGLDTGDIIAQSRVSIAPGETGGSLTAKLAAAGARLLASVLPSIADGTAKYTPQDDRRATKVGKISKKDGLIDFSSPAAVIERQVRGFSPWPGAYTYLDGRTLKIWLARACPGNAGDPGTATFVGKDSFCIQAGDGALECLEVQLEGKKRMPAGDFLRGNALETGRRFGG